MLKTFSRCVGLMLFLLTIASCYRPPYNNFHPQEGLYRTLKDTKKSLIRELTKHNIEVIQYGDQVTMIVPTDQYFEFNTDRLDEIQYKGLEALVRFIRMYPKCQIAVAGFSDAVDDTRSNLKLTENRAHAMVAFLWANGLSAKRLIPQGFGEHYDVGDNTLVHGRAYNRRLEIQWPARTDILTGHATRLKTQNEDFLE